MKINYSIIGFGRSGYKIHYNSINKIKFFNLIGICDLNRERLKILTNNKKLFRTNSYKEIINLKKLNLVIISTNTINIYNIAKFFLEKKIPIVIEKPFGKNIKDFEKLFLLSKINNTKIFPFFNFRYAKNYEIIKDVLDSNIIGKINQIKRNESYFNRRDDWQSKKNQYGGIINAAAIHQIDQILNLINSYPKKILSIQKKIVSKGDANDHFKLMIIFKNNIIADIETSWALGGKQHNWFIGGSNGVIYEYKSQVIVKYFNPNQVKSTERSQFSYLSNEIIPWKIKKFNFNKEEQDNYGTRKFYKNLYEQFYKSGLNHINVKSALSTLKFINSYIK